MASREAMVVKLEQLDALLDKQIGQLEYLSEMSEAKKEQAKEGICEPFYLANVYSDIELAFRFLRLCRLDIRDIYKHMRRIL